MSRAKWKSPYLGLDSNTITLKKKNNNEITTKSRSLVIIPAFVGFIFNIHNGKTFNKINITEKMIGHRLGEFSPTRKKFSFKKKK